MRLDQDTIHKILIAHNEGQPRSAIAQQFNIDSSTVRYHVEKFEFKYGSTQAVYALVRPAPKACTHPSLKCLVCGGAQDHIHRRELQEIRHLANALAAANRKLETLGYEPVKPGAV